MIQVAPHSKQIYEEQELVEHDLQIVKFVSPQIPTLALAHSTKFSINVDN